MTTVSSITFFDNNEPATSYSYKEFNKCVSQQI